MHPLEVIGGGPRDFGGRNSAAISASSSVDTGVVSDGLSTTVLPAAMAGANFQTAIIIG